MRINTNTDALFTMRAQNSSLPKLEQALRRLSSGLRINSARDDAAGLAISDRMTTLIRGMNVAARNANDGVSLLQTAEGGLVEITNMLQRIRELAVQAANTAVMGGEERNMLQEEVQQLKSEVTHIARATVFNGVNILDDGTVRTLAAGGDRFAVVQGLARAWLRESEAMITQFYGLTPNGAKLTIDLDGFSDGRFNTLARAGINANGQFLQIDMADFTNVQVPGDGGMIGTFAYDRVVAHEMAHAVMFNQLNMAILPTWFKEGTAELIHGADDRVMGDYWAGAADGAVDTVDFAADGVTLGGAWGGTSLDYSKAYLAARYLHTKANAMGGMKAIMTLLQAGQTFDQAISATTGFADANAFLADFSANASFSLASLTDNDTGAIGGANADGAATRVTTPSGVVPDSNQLEANPTNFNVVFPMSPLSVNQEGTTGNIIFQVGAHVGDELRLGTSCVTAKAIGIDKVDLVNDPQAAISTIDYALEVVNKERARFGAQMNRMESAIRAAEISAENTSAARARVMDADYARETMELAKSQILQNAATAMTAAAQKVSSLTLDLLR